MSSVGQLDHVLTNVGVNGNTTYTWKCIDASTGRYRNEQDSSSTGRDITYSATSGWSDHTQGYDDPTKFGTSTTDGTAITPSASASILYLWTSTGLMCELSTGVSSSGSGSGSGGGSGSGTLSVNQPFVTWHFSNRSCGESTYVSVTHTKATSSATTYTVHDLNTGQIGTITVGTGSSATANFGFTISARTLQVRDDNGSTLSTKVFTCGSKKAFCNFW